MTFEPPLRPGQNYPTRLLAVDDDPILREFAMMELAAAGCQVDTAADGEEGLERLRAGAYEVLVLDLDMPRLDGFGVLRALPGLGIAGPPPVIVLTSRTDTKALSTAFELGAGAYALKPVNWSQLRQKVRQAFETRLP